MNYKKEIIFCFTTVILLSNFCLLWSYPWPVSSFNSAHPISGTLGEYRSGPPHLHAGVDIAETGVSVYPVTNGTIYQSDIGADYVTVANFDYVHITPNQDIIDWLTAHPGQGYAATTSTTIIGSVSGSHS